MFALVDKSDNSITKMLSGNQGITLNDLQYPRAIYTLWTEAERNAINIYVIEIDDGMAPDGADTNTVATRGLKYNLIKTVKSQAANELAKTDWYITRKAEKSTAIPSAITTHRNLVRSRQAAMETAITNASDTPALETLYTYTRDSDGVVSRPLPEIPTLD